MTNITTELDIKDTIKFNEAKTIKLSKNFTLSEFLYSSTALRKNINNDLPRKYLQNIKDLVNYILQPLRDKFGPIKITSGFRTEELCVAIGSSVTSNHAKGLAADFKPYNKKIKLYDIIEFINDLDYKELIGEYFPTGWIHVAFQNNNNKGTLRLKDKYCDYEEVELKDFLKFS